MDQTETPLGLCDVLSDADVTPVLTALVRAGALRAVCCDERGQILWSAGENTAGAVGSESYGALCHAGQRMGSIHLTPSGALGPDACASLLSVATTALDAVVRNGVERMSTAQAHAAELRRAHEELEQANRQLLAAHHKYEDLADTLQRRVDERTAELSRIHTKLLQKEKVACVGQLAAGVAHQMNTPLQYISGNIRVLTSYIDDLHGTLQGYRNDLRKLSASEEFLAQSDEMYRQVDVPYIVGDAQELARENLEGTERIARIVASLKGFSHIDEATCRLMDLNVELDRTIEILSCAQKGHRAQIVKEYDALPAFYGNPALMSQALLNLLTNALQSRDHGVVVTVRTELRGREIVIAISDNGRGIAEDIRHRIFDPFFTTRDVGQASGMGLAVAYDVVAGHGGTIAVDTEVGRGTRMEIILPLAGPAT